MTAFSHGPWQPVVRAAAAWQPRLAVTLADEMAVFLSASG